MQNLHEMPTFQKFQWEFAKRIRDPKHAPCPEAVPKDRMAVYEELLMNNLQGFLDACYPITREILGEERWQSIARQFFSGCRCSSPLFRDISGSFLEWMQNSAHLVDVPIYLLEFLQYEWLEMVVSISSEELDTMDVNPVGDLLDEIPVVNPTGKIATYHYPVHRICPQFQPSQPDDQLYCYFLYRDATDKVQFMFLNPLSARMLEILTDTPTTGRQALEKIGAELNHAQPEILLAHGLTFLMQALQCGVLLGTRRKL